MGILKARLVVCKTCGDMFDKLQMDRCPKCPEQIPEARSKVFNVPHISCFSSYTTKDITGEPIHIGSSREQEHVFEHHGVSRAEDWKSKFQNSKQKMILNERKNGIFRAKNKLDTDTGEYTAPERIRQVERELNGKGSVNFK